jgi:hypothetical protein
MRSLSIHLFSPWSIPLKLGKISNKYKQNKFFVNNLIWVSLNAKFDAEFESNYFSFKGFQNAECDADFESVAKIAKNSPQKLLAEKFFATKNPKLSFSVIFLLITFSQEFLATFSRDSKSASNLRF